MPEKSEEDNFSENCRRIALEAEKHLSEGRNTAIKNAVESFFEAEGLAESESEHRKYYSKVSTLLNMWADAARQEKHYHSDID